MNAALDLTPLAPTPAPEPLHLMEYASTMLDLTGKNFIKVTSLEDPGAASCNLVNFVEHNPKSKD